MTDKHPITPPPELVIEWADTIYQQTECDDQRDLYVATRAAQWGADQELDACCELVPGLKNYLREHRRPKPATLKEQSLKHLEVMERDGHYLPEILQDLRRAVEQLDD